MTIRIKDVAKLAGVSTATVSRVLANKEYIKESTKKKVLHAIEELGYQPSRIARSLRVNSSQIIGLLVSDIQNPFFTTLARAVEDIAFANDYAVFLCNTDEDINKESIYIDLMISERVAGMIITPTSEHNSPCKKIIVTHKIPIVVVDRQVFGCDVDTVVLNNQKGAYELITHFIQKGHKRIAAIVGHSEITTGRERYQGYESALKDNKIPIIPELIKFGSPKEDVGYKFTNELLDLEDRPTALFLGNNLLTMGALKAINERGLSVSKDISIAAFDETVWSKLIKPPLTVVTQPTYEMGIKSAELILSRIKDPSKPTEFVQFEPKILIRSSG
ncbi:MAG: LacI family DNA-binding transcriptional regulator [Anaerolineales bacterium]|nr:LacI family DNA-binding transcriptional regulator [Anaerolineales bacterium]